MNKVILLGRLTADPEIRYAGDTNVANFTVAVNRRRKEQEHTADFPRCVAFGKVAELLEKYFHKGSQICVSGRIQTGSYEAKDGTRRYTTDVIVEELDFVDKKQTEPAEDWQSAAAGEDPFGLE